MNKFKFFGTALLASASFGYAQDINQVKKAIDAEQFENAKSMLKTIVKATPTNGRAQFLLGNIYLTQAVADSAKIAFQKGLSGTEGANLNYIGLGQLDLDNNNTAGADANFLSALKNVKKKDLEPLVAIANAYTNSSKPNYKKAIEVLTKAKLVNAEDAQVNLALGNAYVGEKNQNDAYTSYRSAFQTDPTLLRAKMQLGVLLKGAKSYEEAVKSFNEVIAINPNYGPVYRELAETYYNWGRNKPSKSAELMKTALGNYEKYLGLTDRSLSSKMRYADFLILVKDYKALEVEANKMSQMTNVNPRIYRYLGYSAYENGNNDLALKSLETFTSNANNKIIQRDYWYLGLAKFKKSTAADGLSMDTNLFSAGLNDLKKAVEIEPAIVEDVNEAGKKLFGAKLYKEASAVFEIGTKDASYKNYIEDNLYYGLAIYYANNKKDVTPNLVELKKADAAFTNITTASPNYQDAYLYSARTNSLMGDDAAAVAKYEMYVAKVTEKGAEEIAKPAVVKKMIESYNNLGANYANTDKVKALDYFAKTLTLDATNAYATESIAKLKK